MKAVLILASFVFRCLGRFAAEMNSPVHFLADKVCAKTPGSIQFSEIWKSC